MTDDLKEAKEGLIDIMPIENKILDLNGNEIILPRVTLGIELKIMHIFFEFMNGVEERDKMDLNEILVEGFCSDKDNKYLMEMISILLNKPVDWILENTDISIITGVLLPFFVLRIAQLTKVIGGIGIKSQKSPLAN